MKRIFCNFHSHRRKGFTLVEVLCAVVVLSCGIIVIFRGLFTSLAALDETRNRLNALHVLHDTVKNVQISAKSPAITPSFKLNGSVVIGRKSFYYDTDIKSCADDSLYRAHVVCYWFQGHKKKKIEREVFLLTP